MLGHSREHARVFSLEILHAPRDSRADARREYTRSYISRGTYKELRIHVRTHVRIAYLYSQTLSLSPPPPPSLTFSYSFLLSLALSFSFFFPSCSLSFSLSLSFVNSTENPLGRHPAVFRQRSRLRISLSARKVFLLDGRSRAVRVEISSGRKFEDATSRISCLNLNLNVDNFNIVNAATTSYIIV